MASFKQPLKELILDSNTTDDAVHGKQAGRFFHGYYDHYCFLPWHVFCQDQLPVSHLRPSNIDGARHAWAILSLLIKRFRQSWPGVSDNQRAMAASGREAKYALSNEKVRWFDEFQYAAKSWKRTRRIIVKIEHTEKGSNPRYGITNLPANHSSSMISFYSPGGEMENRIKEQLRHRWCISSW